MKYKATLQFYVQESCYLLQKLDNGAIPVSTITMAVILGYTMLHNHNFNKKTRGLQHWKL
jgi:hypothetical protein